jgi:hypothetical protein
MGTRGDQRQAADPDASVEKLAAPEAILGRVDA